MEYRYQGFDLGSKVQYLLNGIMCDKLSIVVAAVMVNPDKYEKEFDLVLPSLAQYINKRKPTLIMKVASAGQTRPDKRQKTSTSC